MATLVLTAAGTVLGGPIGGAIGTFLGQKIDQAWLGTKRQGPRLTELAVQTSSYGTQVPKVFGTMRVAGTVIWSTDLIETRGSTGGKGNSGTTTYSYAASFAVLLSARPIAGVRRIWADGKLLRGAAGDFKVKTGFRVHDGGDDQAIDPLIASAEGIALTPAHRGHAYVVFEQLALADFGNRIPSLTFELVANAAAVASGAIVRALADEVVAADDGLMLDGFSASGESVRAVLETVAEASGGWFGVAGPALAFRVDGAASREIADAGIGAPAGVRTIAAAWTVPGAVAVAHYDAARDYQAGLQRARGSAATGVARERRAEVPAALSADAARTVAEGMLARAEIERTRRVVAAGLGAIDVAPGAVVAIAGEAGRWRVVRASVEAMVVTLELVRLAAAPLTVPTSGGRVLAQVDALAGVTTMMVFETPALDDAVPSSPRLSVAANGAGAGWRSAALLLSVDDGTSWSDVGTTGAPAVIGVVDVPPPVGTAALFDGVGSLIVRLARGDMRLFPADDASLDQAANLAMVGDELLQFGVAQPLGDGRWRLSRLLRGRRGSEWAIGAQGAGDRFVLIEDGAIRAIALAPGTRSATVIASGIGDPDPVAVRREVTGASILPLSVARLGWRQQADGGALVGWVRRSRAGWRWTDGADVPLVEESEAYEVEVVPAQGAVRNVVVTVPSLSLRRAERPARLTVRQRGTHGLSRGTTIVVPAWGG
jgi:hypothetical protein